jgi:uncharacterized membrane protein
VAVVFALLAGLLFGLFAVAVRITLRRGGDPEVGAIVITTTGALVALALSAGELARGFAWPDLLPFYLAGLIVPGASQILFLLAIRDAGPARTSVIIGAAPLLSVGIALVFMNEAFDPLLLVATLLVVFGGATLAFDRTRPEHFRMLGVGLAFTCALFFGIRDNVVRWATQDVDPPPLLATTASLAGAATTVLVYLLVFRRSRVRERLRASISLFVPAGVVLALSYSCLVLGFDHGKVSIVAPLNATQSIWGVALSAVFLRQSEGVGKRLFLAAGLVVAGSAIVGIVR